MRIFKHIVVLVISLGMGAPRLVAQEPPKGAQTTASSGPAIRYDRAGRTSGRALIFLPPVGLPGSTWSSVAKEFEKDHAIYYITYAGTQGMPASGPPYFDRAVDELKALIEKEKLSKPVLIGDLLGAHLALRCAGQHPDLVGGTVAAPLLTRRPPANKRQEIARYGAASFRDIPPELWGPNMRLYAKKGSENIKLVDELTKVLAKCDQRAFADWVQDMLADDLDRWLAQISTPTLLLTTLGSPALSSDPSVRMTPKDELVRLRDGLLRTFFPDIRKCEIAVIKDCEMFLMYSQPGKTIRIIRRYLGRLDNPDMKWDTTVGARQATAPMQRGEKD